MLSLQKKVTKTTGNSSARSNKSPAAFKKSQSKSSKRQTSGLGNRCYTAEGFTDWNAYQINELNEYGTMKSPRRKNHMMKSKKNTKSGNAVKMIETIKIENMASSGPQTVRVSP